MKRTDLTIIAGVAVVVLLGAFWFGVLSPKREKAADLQTRVSELESSVETQEQLASTAEAAEEGYDENYHRLVVLGKAVPEDADTSSLLVQLQDEANGDRVSFDSLQLVEGSSSAGAAAQVATPAPLTAPGTTPESTPPADAGTTTPSGSTAPAPEATSTPEASSTATSTETPPASTDTSATPTAEGSESAGTVPAEASATAAAPTEAAAATLPIGATVGPAGLPVMPYDLTFTGGFFEIADFLEGVDSLVPVSASGVGAKGRLLTVDGFSLTPVEDTAGSTGGNDPSLRADLAVTTYLTPADQGLVAGATPATPAAPAATPTAASTTTPAPTP
jgi:Tfp pilus assembly protein PilO